MGGVLGGLLIDSPLSGAKTVLPRNMPNNTARISPAIIPSIMPTTRPVLLFSFAIGFIGAPDTGGN